MQKYPTKNYGKCVHCGTPCVRKETRRCWPCFLKTIRSPEWAKQRFFKRAVKTSACWFWQGSRTIAKKGYGRIRVNGQRLMAHHFSWLLYRGEISKGKKVLHRCDNPICVNPNHLWLGTQQENIADMISKKRGFWFKHQ